MNIVLCTSTGRTYNIPALISNPLQHKHASGSAITNCTPLCQAMPEGAALVRGHGSSGRKRVREVRSGATGRNLTRVLSVPGEACTDGAMTGL